MAKRIAYSPLNASTIDILNVIRQNAGYSYQNLVPRVEVSSDIPKVGEVILGNPAIANEFLNSLLNRIAVVAVKSITFNNPFTLLKKGYVELGETVEEIFVEMAKANEFSMEKAASREFKRTVPDVKSAFHAINWEVQYPVTISDTQLRRAFLSIDGVRNLIETIIQSTYKAAEYDEYLLFKYVLIKQISHGRVKVMKAADDISDNAVLFKAYADLLRFPKRDYNLANVKRDTPKERINIFMDTFFNASFDVQVLAQAFNMDKAELVGRIQLIDDWGDFDNDRFSEITKNTTMIEKVTDEELALVKGVKAVIVDSDFFQFYDNLIMFTETYVGSGMYRNYWLNIAKTVSVSPFANIIAFVDDATADLAAPEEFTVNVVGVNKSEDAKVIEIGGIDTVTLAYSTVQYVQDEAATKAGVGVVPYGVFLIPKSVTGFTPTADILGNRYTATSAINGNTSVGTQITFKKDSSEDAVSAGGEAVGE